MKLVILSREKINDYFSSIIVFSSFEGVNYLIFFIEEGKDSIFYTFLFIFLDFYVPGEGVGSSLVAMFLELEQFLLDCPQSNYSVILGYI